MVTPGSQLKFYYKKHQSILGSGVLEGDLADWVLGVQAKIFIAFDESTGLTLRVLMSYIYIYIYIYIWSTHS